MKQYWQRWSTRIDALSPRERILVFAAAAVLVVALLQGLLLNPLLARQKALSQQAVTLETQMKAARAQYELLSAAAVSDPDGEDRARLATLRQQLGAMDERLQGIEKGLVPPRSMAKLLEDMLRRNGRLQLVSLTTLPVQGVGTETKQGPKSGPATSAGAEPAPGLYRHGVRIVVQGGFGDLYAYVRALEAMPWQMYWGKTELRVVAFPTETLTLTVYTLSLDKTWLSL